MSSSFVSPQAFIERVREHLPSLHRMGRRLAGTPADAEDLVQATLERALERRGELRDPSRLKPWLLAVQRSVFLNARRGRRHRLEVLEGGKGNGAEGAERAQEPSGDLEEELLGRALSEEMKAALEALAPEWREALWLREVEDLSYEEIAQVQDCPLGTVRSRLARARQAMLQQLKAGKEERREGM